MAIGDGSQFNKSGGKKEKEPKVVEVSQWDNWKLVKRGEIGTTGGLGPCVGIVLYDPISKNALLGHFVDPRSDDFEGMLVKAKEIFKNIREVRVYVGGGAPGSYDDLNFDREEEIARRNFVKEKLANTGFVNPTIKYQNSNETTEISIDTRDGNVVFDTVGDDDL